MRIVSAKASRAVSQLASIRLAFGYFGFSSLKVTPSSVTSMFGRRNSERTSTGAMVKMLSSSRAS